MLYILLSIVAVLYGIYLYLTWNYNFWKKHNLPYLPPVIGFGNIKDAVLQKRTLQAIHMDIYKKFSDCKYVGFYNLREPYLFVRDLELIRLILIKDFSFFNSNGLDINQKKEPYISKNPFFLDGEQWKSIRTKISPALSSGRMKLMFPQMVRVSNSLIEYIGNNQDNMEGKGLNAKELFSRYTVDSVGSVAFSLDIKSFENPKSEFREMGRKLFDSDDPWTMLRFMLFQVSPRLAYFFGLSLIPKTVGQYFANLVQNQIEYRKKNNFVANDFMDFMIELREKCTEFDFDETYMASQLMVFFTDGFETSSIVMSFVLYEIAAHPHVQNRLRNEIEEIIEKNNGEMKYDGVMQEMKYLDCIVNETLRLRTPAIASQKQCVASYKFPPPKDGVPGIEMKPGMKLLIPLYSIMRDPNYFPNPDVFDPDRFTDERKKDIVKNTFLSFGEGPRQCIGMRFALMQIKVGIAAIVRNFEVRVHSRTKQPLQEDPSSFLLKPKGGIWITFHKRK